MKFYDREGRRSLLVDSEEGLFLVVEEIRGTKHRYVSVKLDSVAVARHLKQLIADGFAALDKAF